MKINKIYQGDCLEELKKLDNNSIDLIVTDPPYGYSFMGKDWDTFNEIVEPKGAYQNKKGFKKLPRNKPTCMYDNFLPIWKECLRILKSGAFCFCMIAPRQDVLMEQIRAMKDAGFNMGFSSLYWTYASGFPKSSNIGKMVDKRLGNKREKQGEYIIQGNIYIQGGNYNSGKKAKRTLDITKGNSPLEGSYGGFQPKPAVECILVAMKPLSEKTYVDQALKNKKGITWLDDCLIPYESEDLPKKQTMPKLVGSNNFADRKNAPYRLEYNSNKQGRFPANLLVSNDVLNSFSRYFDLDAWANQLPFLITSKASKSEKNRGLEKMDTKQAKGGGGGIGDYLDDVNSASGKYGSEKALAKNIHPTVKPLKLMSYLIILGSREGDLIIDPFAGSGTTLIAAKQLKRNYIGIEKEKDYCEIAEARLKAIQKVMI